MDERIGVVGAGVMGSGIAQVLAVAGHPVTLTDISDEVLERASAAITGGRYGLDGAVSRGLLSAEDAAAARARIQLTADLDAVAGADVVIEAVPEQLDLKIRLFRDLDRRCAPGTILASNSSGFPIAALAAATDRPERVIGWHWASPAPVMRLAEIVRTPSTAGEVVETITALATAAGKRPVVVNDHPTAWGYVANRIYGAMLREASRVVEEGVAEPEAIDQLMVDCFRWPSGPFAMVGGARSGWQ